MMDLEELFAGAVAELSEYPPMMAMMLAAYCRETNLRPTEVALMQWEHPSGVAFSKLVAASDVEELFLSE